MNFLLRYPRSFAAVIFLGGMIHATWAMLYPDLADHQAVLDSRYQPLAVLVGGALPSTILAVIVYLVLWGLAKRQATPASHSGTPATPRVRRPEPTKQPKISAELDKALDSIEQLGALMEIYSSAILDESALPAPKGRMKVRLRVAMAAFRADPARIDILRTAWLFLGSFQPGIGPTPLVPPTLSIGRIWTQEEMAAFERYHELLRAATAEAALNMREADLYLASLEE